MNQQGSSFCPGLLCISKHWIRAVCYQLQPASRQALLQADSSLFPSHVKSFKDNYQHDLSDGVCKGLMGLQMCLVQGVRAKAHQTTPVSLA
jgi:hypothetical protein